MYAPPGSDWSFYKHIFDLMATNAQGITICGGDFNVRLNPRLDCSGSFSSQSKPISKKMNVIMKELGVTDVWRYLNPSSRVYSQFSSPHLVYSRIDYFLIFSKDRNRIKCYEIGTIDLSDHSPVYLTFELNNKARTTLWRLNSSILNGLKEQMKAEINTYLENNDNGEVSPPILWDACKAVMRDHFTTQKDQAGETL